MINEFISQRYSSNIFLMVNYAFQKNMLIAIDVTLSIHVLSNCVSRKLYLSAIWELNNIFPGVTVYVYVSTTYFHTICVSFTAFDLVSLKLPPE